MDVLDLLASDNYIILNKSLAKEIGLENAILFGALCSYQRIFKEEEFFREQEKIIADTCLSEYLVRKSIKELKELQLISVCKKGLPAKYYFKINTSSVLKILSSSGANFYTTGDYKFDTTINNKENNKNNINKVSKKDETFDDILNSLVFDEKLKEALLDFIKMRKIIKKPLTNRALKSIITRLNEFSGGNNNKAILMLDQSIRNSWQDVYELKELKNKNKADFQTRDYTKEELNNLYDSLDDTEI